MRIAFRERAKAFHFSQEASLADCHLSPLFTSGRAVHVVLCVLSAVIAKSLLHFRGLHDFLSQGRFINLFFKASAWPN